MTHYLTDGTPAQALGWEFDSEAAWSYMREVNEAAEALELDMLAQTKPGAPPNMIPQSVISEIFLFMNGVPNVDEEADEVPVGWREWFRSHSSLWSRIWNSTQIVKRTGEYERRLIELHDKFKQFGGVAKDPEQVPGYQPGYKPKPDKESAEDRLIWWMKFGAVAVGAVYLAPVLIPAVKDAVAEFKKPTKMSPMAPMRRSVRRAVRRAKRFARRVAR